MKIAEKIIPDRCNESVRPDSACLVGQSADDAVVDTEFLFSSESGSSFASHLRVSSNLLYFITFPHHNLNLRQPFLQLLDISDSLGETFVI